MLRVQMLKQNKPHAGINRQMSEELRDGFKASGRCPNPYNGEPLHSRCGSCVRDFGNSFTRDRLWGGRLLLTLHCSNLLADLRKNAVTRCFFFSKNFLIMGLYLLLYPAAYKRCSIDFERGAFCIEKRATILDT